MIVLIVIIGLAFAWLGYETDWLRIRLLVGAIAKPKYARYKAYNKIGNKKPSWGDTKLHEGNNYPEGYTPNGEPEYIITLNPGINNVLCGWGWLDKHCADLVDYHPNLYLETGGVRYNMKLKKPEVLKDIMKANKLSKQQRLAYA